MLGVDDVYKVVVAMVPLYVALCLGYGSVKWWGILTPDQSDAINSLVAYFTLPLFTFQFTAKANPFDMNYSFIAADAISKAIIVLVAAVWALCDSNGSYSWFITSFSLSTMTSSLVVGIPLARAMYGQLGVDLVVQSSVVQAIVWLTLLLLMFEVWRARADGDSSKVRDLERDSGGEVGKPATWSLVKAVWLKLSMNPNTHACVIGLTWAFLSNTRWYIPMPEVVEQSILIMSKAGTGTAMFSMGMFMASQKKIIACGVNFTILGMVLRFIAGPAAMAVASVAVGLRGDVLRTAIMQAAIPQSITSFIFAKEYGLHADILSTAVIFGMLVSLPVLVGYCSILEFLK